MVSQIFRVCLTLLLKLLLCLPCNCMFDSLYKNVISVQDAIKDLASGIGLKTVGQTVDILERFVDASVEEDCMFVCPDNEEIPVRNPHYFPRLRGCETVGVIVDEELRPGIVKCCNSHIKCYATCAADKEECDKVLKQCVFRECDLLENLNKEAFRSCQDTANHLMHSLSSLGCAAFKHAQKRGCECRPITGPNKRKHEL